MQAFANDSNLLNVEPRCCLLAAFTSSSFKQHHKYKLTFIKQGFFVYFLLQLLHVKINMNDTDYDDDQEDDILIQKLPVAQFDTFDPKQMPIDGKEYLRRVQLVLIFSFIY